MAICKNCGREVTIVSRNCPFCNTPFTMATTTSLKQVRKIKNEYDNRSYKRMALFILLPLLGMLYFFLKREEYPLKANDALGGSLLGILIRLVVLTIFLVINFF